ncbi:MAG: PAS domain S-box protein [Bacteroidales bacterium]|nr:PAS domain S-box protein [Bacteroidales bacterium]
MQLKQILNKGALKVATYFFVISFLWIFFSDRLLLRLFADVAHLTSYQTLKGWFYVSMATIFVFYLVNREINKKNKLLQIVSKKNELNTHILTNIPGTEVLLFADTEGYLMAHGNNILLTTEVLNQDSIDDKFVLKTDGIKLCLRDIKTKIFSGETFKIELVEGENCREVSGCPVYDGDTIIAGLLVIFDTSTHKQLVWELNEEKQNYEALFNEYHSVNLELKSSYDKLQKNMALLKESKELYENFLMQTTEAVYRIDLDNGLDIALPVNIQTAQILSDGYIGECNPVFANIYGFTSHLELFGSKLSEKNNPLTANKFEKVIAAFLNNGNSLRGFETREVDKTGSEHYFLNNLTGIAENNKLWRLWGIKTDISRIKQYESELITAKDIAEKSDKLKSAFLANMSHEVRTPLNGIIGFSELLGQESIDAEQRKKYFSIVKASNKQLLRIIDDLLDISRIETGQLSVAPANFHINTLLNELESYVKQEIEKRVKNIDVLVIKSLPDGSDMLYSDKQRLYQVLTNILNNAVKFTDKGTIEFGYFTDKSKVEFYVSDTGIGIDDSELGSIFKQFKQVEDYTSRKYGGTGLGLSISKGIVELLGGQISVSSQPGRGSEFKFFVPLIHPADMGNQ